MPASGFCFGGFEVSARERRLSSSAASSPTAGSESIVSASAHRSLEAPPQSLGKQRRNSSSSASQSSTQQGSTAKAALGWRCGRNAPRRCLCMGFSSPLAPFNLLFGTTTQGPSAVLVELAPKTAKGHGRAEEVSWQPWSSGSLETLLQVPHRKARCLQPRSSAPEMSTGQQGQGTHLLCPISSGSVPWQLPVTPPMGQGRPLGGGDRNQLQKTSPLFPTRTSKSVWQTKANVVTSKSCQFQQSGSRFMKASVEDHYRLHRGSRK